MMLSLSVSTLRKLREEGKLRYVKVGSLVRYRICDLETYAKNAEQVTQAETEKRKKEYWT